MYLTPEQTQERIAIINLMLSQGCSRQEIAEALGIRRQALYTFMDNHEDEIEFPDIHAVSDVRPVKNFFGWGLLAKTFRLTRRELAQRTVSYNTLSRSWSADSPIHPHPNLVAAVAEGLGLSPLTVYAYLYALRPDTEDLTDLVRALKAQGFDAMDMADAIENVYDKEW